jgi:hypothetical protein
MVHKNNNNNNKIIKLYIYCKKCIKIKIKMDDLHIYNIQKRNGMNRKVG